MKKITNNKGITLIALIITIIVMLILVAVTVSVAINGELFSKSKYAAQKTEENAIYERILGALKISDDGKINVKETYNEIENMFDTVELIEPKEKTAVRKTAVFEITGKQGTYTYTTTEKELIVGKPEEIIIEKTEISENSVKLHITPIITGDLFTEQEACEIFECNNLKEVVLVLYNDLVEEGLRYETFDALATAKRSEETGLIVLGEIPDFGTVAPFADEYEGFKNFMQTASEIPDMGFPSGIETVQDYVAFLVSSDEGVREKVLKVNEEIISRDVIWDEIVATYSVYNPSTYKIEIDLVLGNIEKTITRTGEITIGKIGSYVGKDVYYSNTHWKVLYDDDEHGIQLISTELLGNGVTFGNESSIEESLARYNNAINILNEECSKLVTDKSKVISIRNVGGPSEETSRYINSSSYTEPYSGFEEYDGRIKAEVQFGEDRTEAEEDWNQMNKLGIRETTSASEGYWYSTRYCEDEEGTMLMYLDGTTGSSVASWGFYLKNELGVESARTNKVRPVITIDPSVEFIWNTAANYYELDEITKVPKVGKNVKYDGKDWKVLYDDEIHGLQLISMQAMGNVTLGKNGANVTVGGNVKEEAIESYNNAITKLTEECYRLISDKSAVNSVRNIGGPATDTTTDTTYTFPNNFFNDSTLFDTYNNKLKIADNSYYTEDYNRMNELNILKTTNSKSSSYWMASRYIDGTTSINFNIRRISPAGDSTWLRLISISKSGTVTTDAYTCQVRPVITIKPEYSLVSNGSYYTLAK